MAPRIASYLAGDPEPRPCGGTDSVVAIYQTFQTTDRPIAVAVGNDRHWQRACGALDLQAMADQLDLATNAGRRARRDEVVTAFQKRFHRMTADEALGALEAAGVPCARVSSLSEVVNDSQVVARGSISVQEHPTAGEFRGVGSPWRLGSEGDGRSPRLPAPLLGEHGRRSSRRSASIGRRWANWRKRVWCGCPDRGHGLRKGPLPRAEPARAAQRTEQRGARRARSARRARRPGPVGGMRRRSGGRRPRLLRGGRSGRDRRAELRPGARVHPARPPDDARDRGLAGPGRRRGRRVRPRRRAGTDARLPSGRRHRPELVRAAGGEDRVYPGLRRNPAADHHMGKAAAYHLLLTGERIDARRAWEIGLLSVPPWTRDAHSGEVHRLAASIAAGSRGRASRTSSRPAAGRPDRPPSNTRRRSPHWPSPPPTVRRASRRSRNVVLPSSEGTPRQ